MVDVTEDARVKAAKRQLEEAKRIALTDHFSTDRTRFGECPRYYGHPSWGSFWTGFGLAFWMISVAAVLHHAIFK